MADICRNSDARPFTTTALQFGSDFGVKVCAHGGDPSNVLLTLQATHCYPLLTPCTMPSRDINTVVAENLRYHMKRKGKSQPALAAATGVGQTTISLYLRPDDRKPTASGKLPSAKVSELALLADALGIHVWELLIDAPDKSREMIRDMILVMTKAGDASQQVGLPVAVVGSASKKSEHDGGLMRRRRKAA